MNQSPSRPASPALRPVSPVSNADDEPPSKRMRLLSPPPQVEVRECSFCFTKSSDPETNASKWIQSRDCEHVYCSECIVNKLKQKKGCLSNENVRCCEGGVIHKEDLDKNKVELPDFGKGRAMTAQDCADYKSAITLFEKQSGTTLLACPGCKTAIEKISGCDKMTCKMCSTVFCYLCLSKLNTKEPHVCSKKALS